MSTPIVTFSASVFGRHVGFGGAAVLWTFLDLGLINLVMYLGWSMQWAVIFVVLFDLNLLIARLDELRNLHDR